VVDKMRDKRGYNAAQKARVENAGVLAASGLIAGRNAARLALGLAPVAPPRTTAIGALGYYVSHADPRHYDPTNITFGILPPLAAPPKSRHDRQLATSQRALEDLSAWMENINPGLFSAASRVPSPGLWELGK